VYDKAQPQIQKYEKKYPARNVGICGHASENERFMKIALAKPKIKFVVNFSK